MEVTVKLKHIIIPLIVIIITLFGLTSELQNNMNNPTLDVAYIYPGNGLATDSNQKFIWETLSEVQNNYSFDEKTNKYDLISLEHLNVETISESQLQTLANKNEIVILYGDSYNKELEEVLVNNQNTYFILIDNTSDITSSNIISIDLNHNNEIKAAATALSGVTKTNKALYVSTTPIEQNAENYELFTTYCTNCEVEYYYVANSNDSAKILGDLKAYFTEGYDIAYVEDSIVYNLVTIAAKEIQMVINEENKAVEENKKSTTPVEIEEVYIQDNIYVIGNNFDMYGEGIYEDTNMDLSYNELDKSVILETYTYNLYETFMTIFTEVINEEVTQNAYVLEPIKVSDIKIKLQEQNPEEVEQ